MNETPARHPDSTRIAAVAERLERAAGRTGAVVDMLAIEIAKRRSGPCETIACHAGWYLHEAWMENRIVGTIQPVAKHWKGDEYGFLRAGRTGTGRFLGYNQGAAMMARDLGFHNAEELESWARDNPDRWGNRSGGVMFSSMCAFQDDGCEPVRTEERLIRIAKHWRKVLERTRAIEAGGEGIR